jgi:uncharacterized protein
MSTSISASPSGPVAESSRVLGIDAARGFALLGILFVNAAFFGVPFGELFEFKEPVDEGLPSRVVYWFTSVFCTGKFYPLFSILFGAGLAMIYQASRQSGRSFGSIYLRRLVVLAGFGIAHIVLLWYGDILLLYASVGMVMLLLGRASPKVLLWVAGSVFSIGIVTSLGFAALSTLGANRTTVESSIGLAAEGSLADATGEGLDAANPPVEPQTVESTSTKPLTKPMPDGANSIEQLGKVLSDWNQREVYDSRLIQLERKIQSQGPFSAALLLRLFLYMFSLVFYLTVTIWVVLPCFCVGCILTKTGFFHDPLNVWRKRLMQVGFLVGLPLSVVVSLASAHSQTFTGIATYLIGSNIAGPLVALGYLSAILMFVERHPQNGVSTAVGQLGRMALTGYLMESLLMSAIMSHWGLGWFGATTWAQRFGLAVAVYLTILLIANLWMSRFRYGPMEWLWRSLTYFKCQPIFAAQRGTA